MVSAIGGVFVPWGKNLTLRDVQLTHLRAFVAVADLGSYTRAAESLGYSEPAVHLQVAALRRTIGAALFERTRGRMHPTPIGKELLPFARESLAAVENLLSVAAQRTEGPSRLEVGVGRSTGSYILPSVVAAFQREHPEVEVILRSLSGTAIVQGVMEGYLDFGLAGSYFSRHLRPVRGNIAIVPWRHFQSVLVATPSVAQNLRTLGRKIPVLLPAFSEHLVEGLRTAFELRSLIAEFRVFDTAEAVRSIALADVGVGLLPSFVVSLELEVGRLEQCLPEVPLREGTIEFIHRRPVSGAALRNLVRFVCERRRDASTSYIEGPSAHRKDSLTSGAVNHRPSSTNNNADRLTAV